MMKSLYAYYGLLDLHEIDSPGHSFYQVGLLDSIREQFGEHSFDFYSYYPEEILSSENLNRQPYPTTPLGTLFLDYATQMVGSLEKYCSSLDEILNNIKNQQYNRLYLKARFRNLSALAKKWKDARVFAQILETAISAGYPTNRIIVLDTDLSLPQAFYDKYGDSLTVLIPSIDFPSISSRFLKDCVSVHEKNYGSRNKSAVFYGNLDTSNYKSGNAKSDLLMPVLQWFDDRSRKTEESHLTIINKPGKNIDLNCYLEIPRNDRSSIWKELEHSLVMINVTKEKYDSQKFIPARVYEAMIFGMIPVSYKFSFISPAFSFETIEDLEEIITYLDESNQEDLFSAYKYFVKDYSKLLNSPKVNV